MARERRSWWKTLAEIGSIVGSILLAFFIDASWASHLERVEEQELLSSLATDFEKNDSILQEAREEHEGIRLRGATLLDSISEFSRTGRVPSVAELVVRQTDWETYDPIEGTLESLIQSGHLDLIESDSLRAALVAWPDQVADLNEDEELLRSAVRDRLLPIVFRHVSMSALQDHVDDGGGAPVGSLENGLAGLLSSTEFANWIRDQVEWRAYLLECEGDLTSLKRALTRTRRLIAQELDD
jgi:hypothetical protein